MRKLVRPKEGRVFAGVCLGLANYLKIDVRLVRAVFIILLLPGGFPGLVPYIVLWAMVAGEK